MLHINKSVSCPCLWLRKCKTIKTTEWDLKNRKRFKCSLHCSVVFRFFLFCFCLCSVCYDRAPWYPTALTFILSALWHGIYPGYYFTFLTGILITLAARAVCTLCCSLLRPMLDTIQLSTVGTTLTWSSSLSLLWALFQAFVNLRFTETLFCIDANCKVPPAVITSPVLHVLQCCPWLPEEMLLVCVRLEVPPAMSD